MYVGGKDVMLYEHPIIHVCIEKNIPMSSYSQPYSPNSKRFIYLSTRSFTSLKQET